MRMWPILALASSARGSGGNNLFGVLQVVWIGSTEMPLYTIKVKGVQIDSGSEHKVPSLKFITVGEHSMRL